MEKLVSRRQWNRRFFIGFQVSFARSYVQRERERESNRSDARGSRGPPPHSSLESSLESSPPCNLRLSALCVDGYSSELLLLDQRRLSANVTPAYPVA